MGLCFSKKQQDKPPPPLVTQPSAAAATTKPKKPAKVAAAAAVVAGDDNAKKAPQPRRASNAEEPAAAVKKAAPVVVKASKAVAGGEEEEKKEEARPVVVVAKGPMPVRTSSCTKEEVDAILIQCGRLSRSSSGKAPSGETGGGHRSKRSCDFDPAGAGGADEECDWEKNGVPVSRPSPHRGSPQRKRSGSRERTSGGSRRSSRSPGRRGEGGAPSATSAGSGAARQQPGKMVSVPAREKVRAPSPAAASGKRCASPRSSSPARVTAANENAGGGQKTAAQTPALSRSSSRKAEQSPLRRSPMAEIDENSLRNNNSSTNTKPQKKSTEIAVATPTRKTTERAKEQSSQKEKAEETIVTASETRAPSSKTTETRTVETPGRRSGRRSRRASRDFDQNPGLYASHLLEDIQHYHTSATATPGTPPSFTLPACVSKAQSIVDAVADLNSSSSESRAREPDRSVDDKASVNAAVRDDDLDAPSVHKYVSVRDIRGSGETELQESAGSNSLSGNLWTPSCESTDRTWSGSRSSNNGDEVVEQVTSHHGGARSPVNRPRQSKQRAAAQFEPSARSRAGSSGVNAHRGRSAHRGSGSVASGRSGVRGVSASS
ncbi:uncharacterized protein At1g65710-like [Hordeum vulgare subsp. vulgare]|uniref:Uncharacterized protein n=1 Tax=Hordeum vulgare subsp. vulgare TaxID=112509 RepID=A0A8I6YK97_HORVV|nr:uncharacterized protein At1g65710-like [Hordeum vulgare subsp. vulgare]